MTTDDSKAALYRDLYIAIAEKWAALLERLDLDEDAQPDDIIAAARGQSMTAVMLRPKCGRCGHPKVHHFGATDGRKPAPHEPGCRVYGCGCKGWRIPDLGILEGTPEDPR